MKGKVWLAFSLVLVLSLALAGCGNRITAEEIVTRMRETLENTTDAYAVVTAQVNAQGIEMSATVEVWEKSPNKLRAEVLDASEADLVGMLLVSDGQQGWAYNPQRNVVMVGPAGELETPLPQEVLTELQDVIQQMLDVSEVELAGEEKVAGRDSYKLTMSPKEGTEQEFFPGNGTATLWVDKEQWIVLKASYEADSLGQGTMEVQTFELNPGLPDDLFTFEAPEGVEFIDIKAQQPVPLTLDEAKTEAGFPVLVPEYVPEGATLVDVLKMEDSIILHYDHSMQVSFTIIQGPAWTDPLPAGQSQDITVRGQSGTVITDQAHGNTFLHWTENDVVVVIAGRISLDEVLKVADSLR